MTVNATWDYNVAVRSPWVRIMKTTADFLDDLPQLSGAAWRRAIYARAWDVAAKVRAAKAAGAWPPG